MFPDMNMTEESASRGTRKSKPLSDCFASPSVLNKSPSNSFTSLLLLAIVDLCKTWKIIPPKQKNKPTTLIKFIRSPVSTASISVHTSCKERLSQYNTLTREDLNAEILQEKLVKFII
jgi:hypothetical protein